MKTRRTIILLILVSLLLDCLCDRQSRMFRR